jgi:hypothetical protein
VTQETEKLAGVMTIPPHVQKEAAALLHQQMWCWGCDIRHTEGNVLLRYTFTRQRPPDPALGSSRYTLCSEQGQHITLWGFGVWYARTEVGGLFLRRNAFSPRLTCTIEPPASIWCVTHLPALCVPTTPEEGQATHILLSSLLSWISDYEQWIQETLGTDYRRRCLKEWPHRVIFPEHVALVWQRLARESHSWCCSATAAKNGESQ